MDRQAKRAVPLEAAIGKENPPCPACGEPLFGWALLRPDSTAVRRCERCSMAVAGDPADRAEAASALRRVATDGPPPANRTSFQAWIGSSGWSALEPGARFFFTPDAATRLGFIPGRPGFDLPGMWQTLVNAFTFGHNVALGRFSERKGTPGETQWQRVLDWVITAATAIPLLLVALVLEGLAVLFRRGGRFGVAVSDAADQDGG